MNGSSDELLPEGELERDMSSKGRRKKEVGLVEGVICKSAVAAWGDRRGGKGRLSG